MTTDISRLAKLGLAGCALVVAVACSDATTPAPPKPPIRTTLSAASGTTLNGTVGTAVKEAPSVVVRDSSGHPVAGVFITFSVTEGGGIILSRAAISGPDGMASVDRWTLGTVAGRNALTATNPAGYSVVFTADAVAGPPTAIKKVFGDGQTGQAAAALLIRPRVRVSDAFDNPVPGVAVTFAIGAGGGSVSAASALTDSAGIAASGDWVLGTAGPQRLVARVGSLAIEPFTARILTPAAPCAASGTLESASIIGAQLSSLGCNAYTLVVPTMAMYYFAASSPDFDTNLQLRGGDLAELAGSDDVGPGRANSGFKVVLAPGTYTLYVSPSKPGTSGSFNVLYNPTTPDVDGCAEAFVVRGVAFRGTAYFGCAPETDNPADRYRIFLKAGDQVDIQVDDWSYSGPNIRMIMPDGRRLEATPDGNYLTRMTTTAPLSGYYLVMIGLAHEAGVQYELRIR